MIALLALSLHLPTAEAAGPPAPLDDPAFRFCNEPGASAEDARAYCELLQDEPPERCPGLRKTCEGAPPKDDLAELMERLQRGCEGRDADRLTPPDPPAGGCGPDQLGCNGTVPEATSPLGILRWVAAIAVAALVLAILRVLVSFWSLRRDTPVVSPLRSTSIVTPLSHDEIPEGPPDDLLAAARVAFAEGRFGDAVVLARGAALRRLAAIERIVLHRARTDREYVRAVSQDPNVEQPLRDVVRAAELHRWGGRALDAEVARTALDAAERLVLLGVILLAALALPGTAQAARYGPDGDAALHEIYEAGGYDVSWRLRGLQTLADDPPDVLVLDFRAITLEAEDRDAVVAWVNAGGVLVAAGDASLAFPELGVFLYDSRDLLPFADVRCDATVACPSWAGQPITAWQPSALAETWVAARDGTVPVGIVVAMSVGEGGVIAIADPRLLHNGSFVRLQNAAFLLEAPFTGVDRRLWTLPTPPRLELATRAGDDTETPFGTLAEANLLPAVLQLLLFGTLLALWRGVAFAPLKDPPEQGRLAFSEHVRMLGLRYARMGATRRALGAVAALWLQRLGRDGLIARLVRQGTDKARATELVDAAEAAQRRPDGKNQPDDLANLEALWKAVDP